MMEPFTAAEVAEIAKAFYQLPGNEVGGNLHIVLDDGNIRDGHIQYCIDAAEQDRDFPAWVLGQILMKCSKSQRAKASKHVYDGDGPWHGSTAWHRGIDNFASRRTSANTQVTALQNP